MIRLVSLCVLAATASACLEPTEIQLTVRTNLDCHNPTVWKGVSIYTGGPGLDVDTRAPTLTTLACGSDGVIGSLVIVPSGDKNAEVGIRVVAGVARPPETCAGSGYQGCIVARRALRFTPHQPLEVVVDLTSDCVGLTCDVTHTCVNGVCEDLTAPARPSDGGAAGPVVRCGDQNLSCATSGQVCCLQVDQDAGTTSGDCRSAVDCPPTSAVLQCNDESDCSGRDDGGVPTVCCLSYGALINKETPTSIAGTSCLSYDECTRHGYQGIEMCQHRQGCVDHSRLCIAANSVMPGYFYCVLVQN